MLKQEQHQMLLERLRQRLPHMHALELQSGTDSPDTEDLLYRFWHQSMKVYALQEHTLAIWRELEKSSLPGLGLDPWYLAILDDGTGLSSRPEDNADWLKATRPVVEAYLQSAYLLQLVIRYASTYHEAPGGYYESGWAAILHLYRMR